MIYDKRLLELAKLALKAEKNDSHRTALHCVSFEKTTDGKYLAIATDGHMLLKAEFPEISQDEYPAYDSIILDAELSNTFQVKGDLIVSAFKQCSKKCYLPILNSISIRANKGKSEVYSTDMSSNYSAVYNYSDTTFPNWKSVIPSEILPQDQITLSGEYLKMIGNMATGYDKRIRFNFHGSLTFPASFVINCKDDLIITGILMPLRESSSNFS